MPPPDISSRSAAHRLSEGLLSARSPEDVGAALMEQLQAALGVVITHERREYQRHEIELADGAGGGVAPAGHNTPEDWKGIVMPRGEGIAGRVLETERALVTNAYQEEVESPPAPGPAAATTAVGLPMAWNGELKGALSVGFSEMRRVTDDDLRTRIILACDAYNAMITTRPYREAMSTEHATAELRAKSGTQFDPRVVGALLERLGAVSEPASEASAS